MTSSKVLIEDLCKALKAEERKMQDQVIHLSGQISYNRKIQEICTQQLYELTTEEEIIIISKTNKSKTKSKKKFKK